MGMFNKSAAKKMASDADEFIVSDGKVHGTLSRIQDKGCQIVDIKMATSANTRDSDMMLYSFTVLYR